MWRHAAACFRHYVTRLGASHIAPGFGGALAGHNARVNRTQLLLNRYVHCMQRRRAPIALQVITF